MQEYQAFIKDITKLFMDRYNLVLIEKNQVCKQKESLSYPYITFETINIEPNGGSPNMDSDGTAFLGVKAELTFSVHSRSSQSLSIATMIYCYFKATREFNIYPTGGIRNESFLVKDDEYEYKYTFDCVFNFSHILDKTAEFIEPEKVPVEIKAIGTNLDASLDASLDNAFKSLNQVKVKGVKFRWK